MKQDKNKKFAYLVLAVAAGLILNEVAPTSYFKTQYRERQERQSDDAQYKFGLNSNEVFNSNVANNVIAQYTQVKDKRNKQKNNSSPVDILNLASQNAGKVIKQLNVLPKFNS